VLTKSIVATSEAVDLNGGPALGFGIRAITVDPLSITNLKTILNPPSASLVIDTHVSAPLHLAAILLSFTRPQVVGADKECNFDLETCSALLAAYLPAVELSLYQFLDLHAADDRTSSSVKEIRPEPLSGVLFESREPVREIYPAPYYSRHIGCLSTPTQDYTSIPDFFWITYQN